jgi:hypothetical protein
MRSCGAEFLPFCKKHRRRVRSLLCYADLKSLRDGRRPTTAYAVCRYDPSREKVNQKNPQIFLIYKLKIKLPLNMARAERRPF